MGKKGFGAAAAPFGKGDLPGFVKKSGSSSSLANSVGSDTGTDRELAQGWEADGWEFDNEDDAWLDGGAEAAKRMAANGAGVKTSTSRVNGGKFIVASFQSGSKRV